VVLLACAAAAAADPPAVKFPTGYREWVHVESMVIFSDKSPLFGPFAGIHHVYVNKIGLAAAKKHGAYPDGSVLVFELLQAKEADGAYTEGPRKLVAVMQKDAKRFASTGGWGFEGFKDGNPAQRLVTDPVSQCFHCHQTEQAHDYVFSQFHE
jgi:hypothetical protein